MSSILSQLMNSLNQSKAESLDSVDIERMSAMLLVEIARADHTINNNERKQIALALNGSSALSEQEIELLIAEVMAEADASLSLHEHVSAINMHFTKAQKISLVEQMWRVALADGNIDQYEEYTVRKLCDLIFVKHRDFMQAKHRAMGDDA
jgi:uncharacterized tellurite resistance protein B-like protein